MAINLTGYRPGQPLTWYHKKRARSNQHCLYCGRFVGEGGEASDKEHLIGRNFVPTGSLAAPAFNFIFRACCDCNRRKSTAERHVSSVTLLNSPKRLTDSSIAELADRKGRRDFSPRLPGVPVGEAIERREISFPVLGTTWTFNVEAPPQLDLTLSIDLAAYQVQAMFSMITTPDPRDASTVRLLQPASIYVAGVYNRPDWGNPQLVELQSRARDWSQHAIVVTARDCYKAVLRRGGDTEGWFWALEWNHAVRVAGCIDHPGVQPSLLSKLPPLDWKSLPDGTGRLRKETPLAESADTLFAYDERHKG